MQEKTNNKTIAKNTLFLYFRMMFTMVISLFTSRIILQKLGVDDYGIYHAVGGVVGVAAVVVLGRRTWWVEAPGWNNHG